MTAIGKDAGRVVRITRKRLLLLAILYLPAFSLGEWMASIVGFKAAFDFNSVFCGWWGAMILAVMLAITHSESAQ